MDSNTQINEKMYQLINSIYEAHKDNPAFIESILGQVLVQNIEGIVKEVNETASSLEQN